MSVQPAKVKPGKAWFLIGALAIVLGIIAFVVILVGGVKRVSDEVDRFARFRVPKEGVVATVTLSRSGTYTLYYEYPAGASDARREVPSDLAVQITTKPEGKIIPITPGTASASFSFSGKRAGRSAGQFTAPAPGRYDIQVTGGAPVAPYDVAVGKGLVSKIGATVLAAFGIGALLGLLGLVTLIVTGVRRGRSKRTLALSGAGAPALGGTPAWPAAPASSQTWPPNAAPAPPVPPAPSAPPTWTSEPAAEPSWTPSPAPAPVAPPVGVPPPVAVPPPVPPPSPSPSPAPPVPPLPAPGGWDAPSTAPAPGSTWDPPPPPPPA